MQPYSDAPDESGFLLLSERELGATIEKAFASGFQVNTHAIGDLANHVTLNALQNVLRNHQVPDHRSRIEHAQIVALDDIERFADLGVIASIQPTHCTSDMNMADDRVGAARIEGAYPWRKFIDAGVRCTGGSDFPVESHNPLWGMYSAVTRQDHQGNPEGGWYPEERMTIAEAVRCFTVEPAFASFQDDVKGTLEVGKAADLVILDRDILNESHSALIDSRVLATIVDGDVVFSRLAELPAIT